MKVNNLLLIGVALLVVSSMLGSNFFSIVSSSNINYDDGSSLITSSFVVNTYDSITTILPANVNRDIGNGKELKASSSATFLIYPQGQPYCETQLVAEQYKFLFGFQSFTYYVPQGFVKHVPYQFQVRKNYDPNLVNETIDLTASSQMTRTFDTPSGQVIVQNLGQLSQGIECPSVSDVAVVVDGSGKAILKSKGQLINALNGISSGNILFIVNTATNVNAPSGFQLSAPANNQTSGVSTLTANKLVYSLPQNSTNAFITVSFDKRIVDAVVFTKPAGRPSLTLSLSKSEILQGTNQSLTVSVQNIGSTKDSFKISPSSRLSKVSISPTTDQLTLDPLQTGQSSFNITGFAGGLDEVCVDVTANGTGLKDNKCISLAVSVPVNLLGQPAPLPTPSTTSQNVTPQAPVQQENQKSVVPVDKALGCPVGYHQVTKDSPVWWTFGLVKETTSSCEKDFPIDLVIIGVIGLVALGIVSFGKFKFR